MSLTIQNAGETSLLDNPRMGLQRERDTHVRGKRRGRGVVQSELVSNVAERRQRIEVENNAKKIEKKSAQKKKK